MLEALGWIGSLCLAFCGIPAVVQVIRDKMCTFTWWFLGMWGIGEICILISILIQFPRPWLIINYGTNIICVGILVWFKVKGD